MRQVPALEVLALSIATAVMLVALVFISGNAALAADARPAESRCTCPEAEGKAARPKFADLNLDESDEIAALESIQVGLSRMDDGSPFVWKRANGRLSGIVRPTTSFRNSEGSLCRHVVVLLTTGYRTRTAEGIACRAANRRWVLEG
ncbi:MAG: hypothetical protein AB7S70_11555 [Hyphomicrobium sp.]|uniref:hypothetical protein n=1 Tax=Hyphomicrobium sp. TaxID=82 RepID=UPI003D14A7AA